MFEIRTDPGREIVFVEATGTIADGDLDAMVQPLRDRPSDALFDVSGVRDISGLSSQAVRTFASLGARSECRDDLGEIRVAVVAPQDALFGLARLFQMQSSDVLSGLEVFRDLAAAREHLGLAEPQ